MHFKWNHFDLLFAARIRPDGLLNKINKTHNYKENFKNTKPLPLWEQISNLEFRSTFQSDSIPRHNMKYSNEWHVAIWRSQNQITGARADIHLRIILGNIQNIWIESKLEQNIALIPIWSANRAGRVSVCAYLTRIF